MNCNEELRARDVVLAQELTGHHAVMVEDLDRFSADLAASVSAGSSEAARDVLVEWIRTVLVPHAAEEEATTYRAARELPAGKLLIDSMAAEHALIRRIAGFISSVPDPSVAAAYGRAVFEIFHSHQTKENGMVLPLLLDTRPGLLSEAMHGAHGKGHGAHSH